MPIEAVDKIWMDGELVAWDEAKVHVLTHTLHYGLGVFEGIRCYRRSDGKSAVFRLREHVERLFESARIADMALRFTPEQVEAACLDTIRGNALDECYIRPLAFVGAGAMGLYGRDNPVQLCIAVWRWGAYLGDEGLEKGIRAKVSSFTRPGVNTSMTKAKIVGSYVNSTLAKREVVTAGYDEAIMLDPQGYVAEASGENVFLIKRGKVITPSLGGSILGGITRDCVLTLCRELGIDTTERVVTRDELYSADEVFFTGTAAEITPVREIDDRLVGTGARGPLTKRLQDRFFQVVRGPEMLHPEWLTIV
jgi:branched-chain amino acid aminotransferase